MSRISIGLISDTHGLLRPEARAALKGVDHIIHAGDICNAEVLEQLAEIAPIVAVRGNNDRGDWANSLNTVETLDIGGVKVHVIHDLHEFDAQAGKSGIQVVISGHSHKPSIKMEGGILFVNPGSAGPRRFKLPISIGYLEIVDGEAKARVKTLEVD
jgi:putative phosphoesterase